jgi:hypothetical protein
MKELESVHKENTEVVAQFPKERKRLGTFKLHPGQKLYQLDTATMEITEVVFDATNVHISGGVKKEVNRREGVLYVPAINAKNADKKFANMIGLKYPKNAKPIIVKE